jgi:hypothetical protein
MESVDVHTGHLNRQSYKGIAVVCQFCEFNANRVPILTAADADCIAVAKHGGRHGRLYTFVPFVTLV